MLDFNTVQVGDIITYHAVNSQKHYYLILNKQLLSGDYLKLKVFEYLHGDTRTMELWPLDKMFVEVM